MRLFCELVLLSRLSPVVAVAIEVYRHVKISRQPALRGVGPCLFYVFGFICVHEPNALEMLLRRVVAALFAAAAAAEIRCGVGRVGCTYSRRGGGVAASADAADSA